MRQLMAQHPSNVRIKPVPIVPIRPYPQLDLLAPVHIQTEEIWVLVRRELGEQADGEVMALHDVPDGGVIGEALKEGAFLRFCYCAIDLRGGAFSEPGSDRF